MFSKKVDHILYCLMLILLASSASTLYSLAPPMVLPDARFKVDILLVVAHPDDETYISGFLARAIYDQKKRVAVVFGNSGTTGLNVVGNEQAAALGAVREIEAREAVGSFGITKVWFLSGLDNPAQDVLASLENWNHGNCLWQLVRLVRLTRPEVIITSLPAYTSGENHGDHQAAGVLATEAFDMAGDPNIFSEQVAPPNNRRASANLTEGLQPWQVKKIYYFSDADDTSFQMGHGPTYSTKDISALKGVPYFKLVAEEMTYHKTQGDMGIMASEAIAKGDYTYFRNPVRLIFGKSLVGGAPTDDLWQGIDARPVEFQPPPQLVSVRRPAGRSIEIGGSWSFYKGFRRAHGLAYLDTFLPSLEIAIYPGSSLSIPVLIHNDTDSPTVVSLSAVLPEAWSLIDKDQSYPVRSNETYPVYVRVAIPEDARATRYHLKINSATGGQPLNSFDLTVDLSQSAMPE